MSVIFIFVDGVGVGKQSPYNPLSKNGWDSFDEFTEGDGLDDTLSAVNKERILYKPIDANLDVEGLPQSGTGQTTLFSGVNASKIAGKHYGPVPYTTTRYLLQEKSLFHKVIDMELKPIFMNAYPDIFFKRAKKKNRWTATTMMARSAGVPLKTIDDLLVGKALTAEITQKVWREQLGLNVPQITVEEAASRLLKAAETNHLVMYEFYLTDKAGHSMDKAYADQIRDILNPFLKFTSDNLNKNDTLVITSDHGNLEDLSVKTHTRNPVPLFIKGKTGSFEEAESILDVTPGILDALRK